MINTDKKTIKKCDYIIRQDLIDSLTCKLRSAKLGHIDIFFSIEILIDKDGFPLPAVTTIIPHDITKKQNNQIKVFLNNFAKVLRKIYIINGKEDNL